MIFPSILWLDNWLTPHQPKLQHIAPIHTEVPSSVLQCPLDLMQNIIPHTCLNSPPKNHDPTHQPKLQDSNRPYHPRTSVDCRPHYTQHHKRRGNASTSNTDSSMHAMNDSMQHRRHAPFCVKYKTHKTEKKKDGFISFQQREKEAI